jgi:cellulose synthase/poly-beta-1,6-N-acetylglucosamine synthase-like glycosyltransferase
MLIFSLVLKGIFIICSAGILIYCFTNFYLMILFLLKRNRNKVKKLHIDEELPFVSIQLPIYNERYVAKRLLDKIAEISYPKERMLIQVLDDSNDDTVSLTLQMAKELEEKGFEIQHLHRENRTGFKAGALKEAIKTSKGDYLAIFDADFLPTEDFLLKAISQFDDPTVGLVQARWSFVNGEYNLLTKLQSIQLNVHFTIEQGGRSNSDFFSQFNGTAGVWRKQAIEEAGGWEIDTLTEDLDLSYRAQLKGWKSVFLVDLPAPSELPVEINGLKSQQHRWMKGGAECAKKLLLQVWGSEIPLVLKYHASIHLLASSVYILLFLFSLTNLVLAFTSGAVSINTWQMYAYQAPMVAIFAVYLVGNYIALEPVSRTFFNLIRFVLIFPIFLMVSMGLCLHNAVAVISGWWGVKTDFIRTPKYGIIKSKDKFSGKAYFANTLSLLTYLEGIFAVLFLSVAVYTFMNGNREFFVTIAAFGIGFLIVFGLTIFTSIIPRKL